MRTIRAVGGKIVGLARLLFALVVVVSMARSAFELHTWLFRGVAAVIALTAAGAAVVFVRALLAGGQPTKTHEPSSTT